MEEVAGLIQNRNALDQSNLSKKDRIHEIL